MRPQQRLMVRDAPVRADLSLSLSLSLSLQ